MELFVCLFDCLIDLEKKNDVQAYKRNACFYSMKHVARGARAGHRAPIVIGRRVKMQGQCVKCIFIGTHVYPVEN